MVNKTEMAALIARVEYLEYLERTMGRVAEFEELVKAKNVEIEELKTRLKAVETKEPYVHSSVNAVHMNNLVTVKKV